MKRRAAEIATVSNFLRRALLAKAVRTVLRQFGRAKKTTKPVGIDELCKNPFYDIHYLEYFATARVSRAITTSSSVGMINTFTFDFFVESSAIPSAL